MNTAALGVSVAVAGVLWLLGHRGSRVVVSATLAYVVWMIVDAVIDAVTAAPMAFCCVTLAMVIFAVKTRERANELGAARRKDSSLPGASRKTRIDGGVR